LKPDLNNIISEFGPVISRVAHRMIKDNEVAKEAAQEVWVEIIKSLDTFKGNSSIST